MKLKEEIYERSLRGTDEEYDYVKEQQMLDILIQQHFKAEPKKREIKFAERSNDNPSEAEFAGQF